MPTTSHADAVDRIRSLRPCSGTTALIAIDGHGGAGKTTLARQIARKLGNITVVCLDDFGQAEVVRWDRERFRTQVLAPFLASRPGRYQRWDWDQQVLDEWHDVSVGDTVIVEGVSTTRVELGNPWNLTIWVEAPEDIRLRRGIDRDGEAMRAMWEQVWIPGENAYVASQVASVPILCVRV
jgi:uridine kinase